MVAQKSIEGDYEIGMEFTPIYGACRGHTMQVVNASYVKPVVITQTLQVENGVEQTTVAGDLEVAVMRCQTCLRSWAMPTFVHYQLLGNGVVNKKVFLKLSGRSESDGEEPEGDDTGEG